MGGGVLIGYRMRQIWVKFWLCHTSCVTLGSYSYFSESPFFIYKSEVITALPPRTVVGLNVLMTVKYTVSGT